MPPSDLVAELMLQWEAARQQGANVSPEQLAAGDLTLADELRRRIRAVLAMEHALGVTDHDPNRTMQDPLALAPATRIAPHPDAPFSADPEPLPTIPGYEIIRVIDQGGMGIVYEARQSALGRTVAVKMISGGCLRPQQVTRFRLEAEAAAKLQHPNFVQVFEVGQVNGRPFFSMEYVNGGSLAEALVRQPLSARQAAELIETLALAVHVAHERGIVHRDLKPSNVMLAADGTPKIADFGLAKRMDDDSQHTHSGEILGTPSYMAPEQAEGRKHEIGPATDVYALGTILYELLTGAPPFRGTSPLDSLRQVLTREPVAPSRLAPASPRDLDAICLKCLEKTPAQRYGSARALAEDLRRFLNGQPVKARRIGPARRLWKWMRRHPQAVALGGTVTALVMIPLVALLGNLGSERDLRRRAQAHTPLVRDILQRHCMECHGGNPAKVEKSLNILSHKTLLDSARRIVVPGAPEDSRLIQRIADGSMPPEEDEVRLPRVSEPELVILKEWILGGAPAFPDANAKLPGPSAAPHSELAAKVKAIFHRHCYECHSYDDPKSGIKILHHRLLITVRKVVVPGRPDTSELFQLIDSHDDKARMPPPPAARLAPQDIADIRAWILAGAPPFPKSE